MSNMVTRLFIAALLVSSAAACKSKEGVSHSSKDHSAEKMEAHECASCGMIVRDQPAPRGQLIHRDNTRLYFCSASDMLTYLTAPSPHGSAVSLFVESMDQVPDPLVLDIEPQPWIDATRASYVVGFEKVVMGDPILAYTTQAQAQAQASRLSAQVMTWTELRAWTSQRRK